MTPNTNRHDIVARFRRIAVVMVIVSGLTATIHANEISGRDAASTTDLLANARTGDLLQRVFDIGSLIANFRNDRPFLRILLRPISTVLSAPSGELWIGGDFCLIPFPIADITAAGFLVNAKTRARHALTVLNSPMERKPILRNPQ